MWYFAALLKYTTCQKHAIMEVYRVKNLILSDCGSWLKRQLVLTRHDRNNGKLQIYFISLSCLPFVLLEVKVVVWLSKSVEQTLADLWNKRQFIIEQCQVPLIFCSKLLKKTRIISEM